MNNLDYEGALNKTHLGERIPLLDKGIPEKEAESMKSPRTFKKHFTLEYLPDNIEKISKVISYL